MTSMGPFITLHHIQVCVTLALKTQSEPVYFSSLWLTSPLINIPPSWDIGSIFYLDFRLSCLSLTILWGLSAASSRVFLSLSHSREPSIQMVFQNRGNTHKPIQDVAWPHSHVPILSLCSSLPSSQAPAYLRTLAFPVSVVRSYLPELSRVDLSL